MREIHTHRTTFRNEALKKKETHTDVKI